MNSFRTALAATLTLAGLGASALAVSFGNLNVTPRGPQNLNLETGVTEFPQGGTATDAKNGMKLVAARMQMKPGKQLTANDATITTAQGGTLKAGRVVYDLEAGIVTATGAVTYQDTRFRDLQAANVTLHLRSGFVTATGGVRAAAPALSTPAISFDSNTMQALALAPATLTQGGQKTGVTKGQLLITFSGNTLLRATDNVDAATLNRFAPYLK